MNSINLENAVVGTEVGFVSYFSHGTVRMKGYSAVKKANRQGIVLENGMVFDARGNEKENKYHGCILVRKEWLEERVETEAAQLDAGKRMMALEKAVADLVRGKKNGYGMIVSPVTGEEKDALLALVAAL